MIPTTMTLLDNNEKYVIRFTSRKQLLRLLWGLLVLLAGTFGLRRHQLEECILESLRESGL